jgi:hypothetical protein
MSILLFIDFFDLNIKKYVIKICLNMTKYTRTVDTFNNFILPAIPSLTLLTKLSGNSNSELDKFILDNAIQCFYNLAILTKSYSHNSSTSVLSQIIKDGLFGNLFEIMNNCLTYKKSSVNGTGNINIGIYFDTLKNIFKLFQLLCELSSEISNILIEMNIIEVIFTILKNEFDITGGDKNKNSTQITSKIKMTHSHHSILNEIFYLIHSFYPKIESETVKNIISTTRAISDNNSHVYIYFSENIISLLIENFNYIPSSHTSLKVLKLISVFLYHSNDENIIKYVDPSKMSNILSSK